MKIYKPCWILCSPRTGSSLLCSLLNSTQLFDQFLMKGTTEQKGPCQSIQGSAFNEWLRLYPDETSLYEKPPKCLKALDHQLFHLSPSATPERLRCVLPEIVFVKLSRRNLFEQAVSECIAKETKMYHAYDDEMLLKHKKKIVQAEDKKLLYSYENVKKDSWKNFEKHIHLEVFYEDLCSDPIGVIRDITSLMGINFQEKIFSGNSGVLRMEHPQSRSLTERLKKIVAQQTV